MIEVQSEITASVLQIAVEVDARVEAGGLVVLLESMKMEIPVDAPVGGVVVEVRVEAGAEVREGDVLVVIDPR